MKVLDLPLPQMVKVAKQLPWPPPPRPPKPSSPPKVFLLALVLPMSLWALAMNSRIYSNKSKTFFVLSIPALLILKFLSLLFSGIKRILTEKP